MYKSHIRNHRITEVAYSALLVRSYLPSIYIGYYCVLKLEPFPHTTTISTMTIILPFVFSAAFYMMVGYFHSACAGSVFLNSNAIKNIPGVAGPNHPVSASPDEFTFDSGTQNLAIDTVQSLSCSADEECGDHGFCLVSGGACLPCKKRRKRCIRDAVCCPGNQCSNGLCLPSNPEIVQHIGMPIFNTHENSTVELHSKLPTQDLSQPPKGLVGENCLRSSDCTEGLCCARHFWSKICKPVVKDGQVCTKHQRKGTHGLEIFQRCDCGDGLSCRTQRGEHNSKASRSLHTCQRH
ncbi:dickkopf-related protein 1 [Salmo trutta]|uniref:Dickkopf WNT signaling pathway inhibitor 1b n=1 Tax=Salmo trutta TaxID=8032 RepID=A0A673ZK54_SALTR|nr:dickkopf-related protein 1-like [Salmo trutta]